MWRTQAWALLVLVLVPAIAPAQPLPGNVTVNVDPEDASGRILVNGVPIGTFGAEGSLPAMGIAIGTGIWMIEGENTVVVEAKAAGPKPVTQVTIIRSMADPPIYEGSIAGAGRIEQKLKAEGIPRWSWLDAEPWKDDRSGLFAAIAALHAAYAAKDLDRIEAARKPLDEDFTKVMGPPRPEERAQEQAFLQQAELEPLATEHRVTTYHDGRLIGVARLDGAAPIVLAAPGSPVKSEIARYWIRKDGAWLVAR